MKTLVRIMLLLITGLLALSACGMSSYKEAGNEAYIEDSGQAESEDDDAGEAIRDDSDDPEKYTRNMSYPVEIYTFFHHFSDSKEVNINDPNIFWMMLSVYATMETDDKLIINGGKLAESFLDDDYGEMLILSEEDVRDAVNAMMPGITEYPAFPDIEGPKPYKQDGYYYFPLIDLDSTQAAIMTDIEINDDGTATAIAEAYSHSYSENVDYVLETYQVNLIRNDKINLNSPKPYPFSIESISVIGPQELEENKFNNSSDSYKGIIEQYQEILANHYNHNELESLQSKYPLLNFNLIDDAYGNEYGLSCWLYDIDHNGTEELIIASDYQNEEIDDEFYALYTQGDSQIIPLITHCVYRIFFYVCEDGSIIEYSSTSAKTGKAIVYKMNELGNQLVLNDEYDIDYENYPNAPYSNKKERLTKEEFDSRYREVDSSVFIPEDTVILKKAVTDSEENLPKQMTETDWAVAEMMPAIESYIDALESCVDREFTINNTDLYWRFVQSYCLGNSGYKNDSYSCAVYRDEIEEVSRVAFPDFTGIPDTMNEYSYYYPELKDRYAVGDNYVVMPSGNLGVYYKMNGWEPTEDGQECDVTIEAYDVSDDRWFATYIARLKLNEEAVKKGARLKYFIKWSKPVKRNYYFE